MSEEPTIFGHSWDSIKRAQAGDSSALSRAPRPRKPGADYGSDPLGDGKFRMVPSGDIVDRDERNRRLSNST